MFKAADAPVITEHKEAENKMREKIKSGESLITDNTGGRVKVY